MKCIWNDIEGYEGIYQVSNAGIVKSLDRRVDYLRKYQLTRYFLPGKILKFAIDKDGYKVVKLCLNGVAVHKKIHRLVATQFVANPFNYEVVNHLDTDKLNNNAPNLKWCTTQENTEHARQHGLLNGNRKNNIQNSWKR